MRTLPFVLLALMVATTTAACRSGNVKPSIPTAAPVDVDRFMGDWYVIAHIPSFPEREAYKAVESYARMPDGRIQTTFRYRKGALDGPQKTMHPVGTVEPATVAARSQPRLAGAYQNTWSACTTESARPSRWAPSFIELERGSITAIT